MESIMRAQPATSTFPSTVGPAGPTAAPAPWQVNVCQQWKTAFPHITVLTHCHIG